MQTRSSASLRVSASKKCSNVILADAFSSHSTKSDELAELEVEVLPLDDEEDPEDEELDEEPPDEDVLMI